MISAVTRPAGEKAIYGYDAVDRRNTLSDAAGLVASLTFDKESGITSVTDGANRKWTLTPDPLGLIRTDTSPLGETKTRIFDKRNRLSGVKDGLGGVTSYTFDPRGPVNGIVQPGSLQTVVTRDALGYPAAVVDANGNTWTRAYDNLGRLISKTDPLGNKIAYTYNSRNQVASATSSLASVKTAYDADGNLTGLQYSDGTNLTFSSDANRRGTGGTGVSVTRSGNGQISGSNGLSNTRDGSNKVLTIAYPKGNVTYSYNNRGLLRQVTDWTGATVTMTYEASLKPSALTRSNGVTTAYTWSGDGDLSGVTETGPNSTPLASMALTRDAVRRITGATRVQPQSVSTGAGSLPLTYDKASQLTQAKFDALGRITQDWMRSYTFDAASRLMAYQGSDGNATFTSDAYGNRVSRTSGGVTENYVLNYATPLPTVAVVRSGGADTRYYIWSPDGKLLWSVDAVSGSHRFYHFDEAGNTLMLTDDSGGITDSYGISAYGEAVTHNGSSANPFTWQGASGVMQEGGTSLYYMRARYYDSASARFLSRDKRVSMVPRGFDPYQYAYGNPIGYSDPSGNSPVPGRSAGGGYPGSGDAFRAAVGDSIVPSMQDAIINMQDFPPLSFSSSGYTRGSVDDLFEGLDIPVEEFVPAVGDLGGPVEEIL